LRQFFMVWNPAGRAPIFKHPDPASAEREAKRLASLNPGAEFFILTAVKRVCREDPVSVTDLTDHFDDDVPF
jgi:hypothetical protein